MTDKHEERWEYPSEGQGSGRKYLAGCLPLTLLLTILLALAACGHTTTAAPHSVTGACLDPPRSYPPGFFLSCEITFESSASYAQALRTVTDLGLQPTLICPTTSDATINGRHVTLLTRWQPLDQRGIFQRWHSLIVFQTPLTIDYSALGPPWWYQLRYDTPNVAALHQAVWGATSSIPRLIPSNSPSVYVNAVYTCAPGIPSTAVTPSSLVLLGGAPSAYIHVAFVGSISYDTAIAIITRLGIRLADPCFENAYQNPNAPQPPLVQGQEANFAVTHTLVVAASHAASTLWQSQLSATPGVSKVTAVGASYCVP